jgi:hypothetical protein
MTFHVILEIFKTQEATMTVEERAQLSAHQFAFRTLGTFVSREEQDGRTVDRARLEIASLILCMRRTDNAFFELVSACVAIPDHIYRVPAFLNEMWNAAMRGAASAAFVIGFAVARHQSVLVFEKYKVAVVMLPMLGKGEWERLMPNAYENWRKAFTSDYISLCLDEEPTQEGSEED